MSADGRGSASFPLLSANQIATAFGVQYRTASGWAREPSFPPIREKRGRIRLYHLHDVVRWYVDRELASRGGGEDGAPEVLDLTKERARLARAQAEAKELELARSREEVIPRGTAAQILVGAVLAARQVLLSVHAKCADIRPDLPPEVIEEIRRRHHEALQALSDAPVPRDGS